MNQILITQNGYEKLKEECARLSALRNQAAQRLHHSLEFGGVAAENGEYVDAHQELDLIELRLSALEQRLVGAEVVAPRRDGVVDIGEAVTVLDLESGEVSGYRIVGTGESDPPGGAVSHHSPVGRALIGRAAGDVVEVEAPSGRRRLEILQLDG